MQSKIYMAASLKLQVDCVLDQMNIIVEDGPFLVGGSQSQCYDSIASLFEVRDDRLCVEVSVPGAGAQYYALLLFVRLHDDDNTRQRLSARRAHWLIVGEEE